MSNTNEIFQVDYLPDEKKIKINLPEEVWRNINTIIMTRLLIPAACASRGRWGGWGR